MSAFAASRDVLWLGGILTGVLLLASTVCAVIKARLAPNQRHPGIDNLVARVRSWWFITAVLGAALLLGIWTTYFVYGLIALTALREYLRPPYSASISAWLAGLVICVVCIAFVPALLHLNLQEGQRSSALLIAFLMIVTQTSDVLQYIWGKLAGKHLIAPRISPSKTVEGFAGGVLSATLIGTSLWWITPFTPLQAAWISSMITSLGFLGGLLLSAQKRARGIKDWGNLIAGHGGVLDRVDSLWLPAPVFYLMVQLGWSVPT